MLTKVAIDETSVVETSSYGTLYNDVATEAAASVTCARWRWMTALEGEDNAGEHSTRLRTERRSSVTSRGVLRDMSR